MLTVELVRARRQGDELLPTPLGKQEEQALSYAAELFVRAQGLQGKRRDEAEFAIKTSSLPPTQRKIWDGLAKVFLDHADFRSPSALNAPEVRKFVFGEAAAKRKVDASFDRRSILNLAASHFEVDADEIETALFSDLKQADILQNDLTKLFDGDAKTLLREYLRQHALAPYLRATHLEAHFASIAPPALRTLVQKLKFRRLLFEVRTQKDATTKREITVVRIAGPLDVLSASARYGAELVFTLPWLLAAKPAAIEAVVLWGTENRALRLRGDLLVRDAQADSSAESHGDVEHELSSILKKIKADGIFAVHPGNEIVRLGDQIFVPDYRLVHRESGREILLESLGYWSREALFRKLEASSLQSPRAQPGKNRSFLFCVSHKLRVDASVADLSPNASIYVYKQSPVHRTFLQALLDCVESSASRKL